MLPRHFADRAQLVERPDHATAEIVRLLDAEQAGARDIPVAGGDCLRHLLRAKNAPLAVERLHQHAGVERGATLFRAEEVRLAVGDDRLARLGMHLDRNLVAHRAAGQEERRLLAQQLGHHRLQPVNRGVLPLLLVADLRLGNRAAHGRRRLRRRVAVEIDQHRSLHGW
jgi:hypothetical protein